MAARRGANKELVERLRSIPLFSGCSARELASIASYTREASYQPGREIVTEGDMGVGLHVILEGETKVMIDGQLKQRLGPGAFFGEIALLDRGPRTATVVAETPVRTATLSSWNFRGALKAHPSIAVKMLEELARRIRRAERSVTH
jgi:CRP/FNR family cyclic AMP-dependent transcriptional regulator